MATEGVERRSLEESSRSGIRRFNEAVSKSMVGKYFKLEDRNSTFTTEIRAGTATFLTMVYIIFVNSTLLTNSGGTCSVSDCTPTLTSNSSRIHTKLIDPDCRMKHNIGYENCLSGIKSDIIVATCVSSMIGSVAMGLLTNLPLAVAPGMGVNAYFAYNMVGFHGSGSMTYQTALAVCLVEGAVFLAIAIFGLRGKLARIVPKPVRFASAAGIGIFIAFTGFTTNNGLGLVGPSSSTLVTLTACSETNPLTGECVSGVLTSPKFWLGMVGFVIMCYSFVFNIKGSMMYGIVFVTLVSWFRNTSVTMFPNTLVGDQSYDYFKKVVDFHTIKSTAGALSFSEFSRGNVLMAMFTLIYVEVLGTTSVIFSVAEIGGFTDENGKFEGEFMAYVVDAASIIVGSLLGTSPMGTYVESSAGIKEGGRTGLTAVVVGVYFLLSLFFAPLLVSVPPWATGASLVMVGVMMIKVVKQIDWENPKDGIPAFVTMILMPLVYNISYGLIGGLGVYIVLHMYDYIVSIKKLMSKRVVCGAQNEVSAAAAQV